MSDTAPNDWRRWAPYRFLFSAWRFEQHLASTTAHALIEAQSPLLVLEGEAARTLAELGGVMQDLAIVEQTCERAVALLSAPGPVDQIVFRALSDAAIVRYARCFNSGQRYRLSPEMLSDLPGDPLGAHQFFYLMRDKHVGHSANAYEQLVMAVSVGEGAKGELTWGTAFTLHASHMAIDVDGFRMLRDLSRALQAKCQALRTTMGEAVRGELAKMTPTQMSGLKPYEFVAPGPDHVARRRRVKP